MAIAALIPAVLVGERQIAGRVRSATAGDAEKQSREAQLEFAGIPRTLLQYLDDHLPNFELPKNEEADPTILQGFTLRGSKQPSPFACSGDFNGDGLKDFALLLRDKARETLELLAFHQTHEHTYTHFVLWKVEFSSIPDPVSLFYLECEKPGKKRDFHGARAVDVKNDSITVDSMEGAGELFYFGHGRYTRILIGGH